MMKGFDPRAEAYCPANAYWLGLAADLAYQDAAVIEATVAGWGLPQCRHTNRASDYADTQAFVAAGPEVVIVAFRGTKEGLDLVTDVLAKQDTLIGGKVSGRVHQGFLHAFNIAWMDVWRNVVELRKDEQPIWVTGHSLGAALATLAVARLVNADKAVQGLYTFGSPRVGDRRFVESFDAETRGRVWRHVNDKDVVTRVAPEELMYGHVGAMTYFDERGVICEPPSGVQDKWAGALRAALALLGIGGKAAVAARLKEHLDDHAMACYVNNLKTAAQLA
jgi:triacylglycerol lipase